MDIKSEIRVSAAERRKVLKSTNLSYFLPGHTQHYFLFCSSKVFPVRLPEAHFTPFCTLKDDVPEKNPFMGVAQITPLIMEVMMTEMARMIIVICPRPQFLRLYGNLLICKSCASLLSIGWGIRTRGH